ncbi:MAG: hypothetical protein WD157_00815 [Patescibacteria group bacterium]
MTRVIQALLALIISVFAFGFLGQWGSAGGGTVDIALIAIWLFTWLGVKDTAIVFAIMVGLLFDSQSFLPFGYWTIMFLLVVLLIDWLKNSYLTVSSFYQAVVVLMVVSFLMSLITSLLLGTTNLLEILTSVLLNLVVGGLIYYLLAFRLKMFQRWTGKRL